MTRHAVKPFSQENILSGKLLGLVDPTPHLGLCDAEVTSHLAVAASDFATANQCFVAGGFFVHEAIYTELNRKVNEFVACAVIQFRIGIGNG
ncbi:hypothetical protein NRB_26490 [Novosphingobium sp. 11B]